MRSLYLEAYHFGIRRLSKLSLGTASCLAKVHTKKTIFFVPIVLLDTCTNSSAACFVSLFTYFAGNKIRAVHKN
jgi:hypothetical protein